MQERLLFLFYGIHHANRCCDAHLLYVYERELIDEKQNHSCLSPGLLT